MRRVAAVLGALIAVDRRLLGPEWVSQNGGLSGESFRRGQASLYIRSTDESTSFSVDHLGYDR